MTNVIVLVKCTDIASAKAWMLRNLNWMKERARALIFSLSNNDVLYIASIPNRTAISEDTFSYEMVGKKTWEKIFEESRDCEIVLSDHNVFADVNWYKSILMASSHVQLSSATGSLTKVGTLEDKMPSLIAKNIKSFRICDFVHGVVANSLPPNFVWLSDKWGKLYLSSVSENMAFGEALVPVFDVISLHENFMNCYLSDMRLFEL